MGKTFAVAGKGGVGKTSFTALVIKALASFYCWFSNERPGQKVTWESVGQEERWSSLLVSVYKLKESTLPVMVP